MALGFEQVVRHGFGEDTEIVHFEQHRHFCVLPGWHPFRLVDRVPHGRASGIRRALNGPLPSRLMFAQARGLRRFKIAIGCGGPNIVRGVAGSPEMRLMLHNLYGAFSTNGVPTLDLGVGACFPLEQIPANAQQAFSPDDIKCYQRLFALTTEGTVRDPLAQRLWAEIGRQADLIPCAAFCSGLAFDRILRARPAGTRDAVVINFQERGANEDWGQNIDQNRWREVMREIISQMRRRHRIVFLCHSEKERQQAQLLDASLTTVQPRTIDEYAEMLALAMVGLVSRIHAAIPLAGVGVPSVVVGTDSRLGAAQQLGLPTHYVKSVNANMIVELLESLISRRAEEEERLRAARQVVLERYVQLVKKHAT